MGTMISRTSGAQVHPVSVREDMGAAWRALAPSRGMFDEFVFPKKDWEFTESQTSELNNAAVYASLADGAIFTVVMVATGTVVGHRMKINAAWYVDMPTHLGIRPAPMPINQLGPQFKIVAQ